jgi:hypothetical protein
LQPRSLQGVNDGSIRAVLGAAATGAAHVHLKFANLLTSVLTSVQLHQGHVSLSYVQQ